MTPVPIFLALAMAACARPRPPVSTPTVNVQSRLDAAGALLRIGCFDCLIEALREYDAVRALANISPTAIATATAGNIRAAALLDLRSRELGMTDDGYLQRARDLMAEMGTGVVFQENDSRPHFSDLAFLLDIADTLPWRTTRSGAAPTDLAAIQRLQAVRASRDASIERLRLHADEDELSAYVWIAFTCTHGDARDWTAETVRAPLQRLRETPLAIYRLASCGFDRAPLADLLRREPRFVEIAYWQGMAAIGLRRLDEAEEHLMRAFEWRSRWPAVTLSLANLLMTAEELERALEFYDKTLTLTPDYPEASIGRVRALSYLARHDDAFQAIDGILNRPNRGFPGEAYYWRAWNDVQVGRIEDAWADVQQAERLWVNSEVSKLAGIIAYRRGELDVAREKFEAARKLNPNDCEIPFNLGNVLGEQSRWAPMVEAFMATTPCVEAAQQNLRNEIDKIQASSTSPARKAHQIARREQRIASAGRMLAQSWFNAAVAYFNLSKKTEARQCAEKVTDDEQFGTRARDLLSRLK